MGTDSGSVTEEISEIQKSLDLAHHSLDEPFFQQKYRTPILLAVAIAMFNQLSGINALMYYAPHIFRMSLFFLIAGFLTIAIHLVFVLVGAKLLKLDVSMAAVASVASVGGAASAPVAAGYHREELVPVSIMLALIGYALGNYLGVAAAYLCNMIT